MMKPWNIYAFEENALNSGFGKSSGIDLDIAKICASHGMR